MEELLRRIAFECIWHRVDCDSDRAEVMSMWRKYQALDEATAEHRAREIVFVIKDGNGEVRGVSTARSVRAKFLNNDFFYEYRCFISPDFRAPGLDTALSVKTKKFLESVEGSPEKHKGLLMVVESEALKNAKTLAVWPGSEMVFVGYTSQGHHIRVGYFEGAKIEY